MVADEAKVSEELYVQSVAGLDSSAIRMVAS
jgi:hypothetical protein